ncbi:MAG: hypothetical protein ABIR47_07600, partial [Candidatus Kapaibacterium sp.]
MLLPSPFFIFSASVRINHQESPKRLTGWVIGPSEAISFRGIFYERLVNIFQAIVLGLIQGLTEFLPI